MTTPIRPLPDHPTYDPALEIQQEFSAISAAVRRVVTALRFTADPLDRVRLGSELRNVQLEIDAFLKRHDSRISAPTRKYLNEASLQIEIKLTAMAATAARRARSRPRRSGQPSATSPVSARPSPGKTWRRPGMPRRSES